MVQMERVDDRRETVKFHGPVVTEKLRTLKSPDKERFGNSARIVNRRAFAIEDEFEEDGDGGVA